MKILIRISDASRAKNQNQETVPTQAKRKIRDNQAWSNKEKIYSYEHRIKMTILMRPSDSSREKKRKSDFSGMGP